MTFRNSILAGVTLIREAIQSQNFVTGVSGWQIAADGTAEFADLTIRSSDGTSSTIVLANGSLVIRNGSSVIVVEIDASGYRLYDSAGVLVAEITLFGGATNDPGFIAYAPSGRRYYAMLSRGFIEFGEDGASYDVQPFIEHNSSAGADPLELAAGSGFVGNAGADEGAVWRLISKSTAAGRPRMEVDSDFGTAADLTVTGGLSVGDTTFTTYTPTVANGGTATFTTRTGWYYRLGSMVFFNVELLVNAAGSGASFVTITAPTGIDRTTRQVVPAQGRSVFTAGIAANGSATALTTGAGAVFDEIVMSNDNALNRDGLLTGAALLAGARLTLSGWYRAT